MQSLNYVEKYNKGPQHHDDPKAFAEDNERFLAGFAKDYDQDVNAMNYHAPKQCAQTLQKYVTIRPDLKVIDICCGTGLAGVELRALGLTDIDGLDISESILAEARAKNIYKKLIHSSVGHGVKVPIPDDTYDAITMVGGLIYMKEDSIMELIRITKPGGIFISIGRACYFEKEWYGSCFPALIKKLQEAGKVEELETSVAAQQYYDGHDCHVLVYRFL